MNRLRHILSHLNIKSNNVRSRSTGVSSLEVFEFMNAILEGGDIDVNEKQLSDPKKLRGVFNKIDLDGSGDIDLDEFSKAARLVSMIVTDAEIERIFNKLKDIDSKTITFKGFSNGISSIVEYSSNKDLIIEDRGVKLVIDLWNKHMNGNRKASDLFTKNLLRNTRQLKELRNIDLDRQLGIIIFLSHLCISVWFIITQYTKLQLYQTLIYIYF